MHTLKQQQELFTTKQNNSFKMFGILTAVLGKYLTSILLSWKTGILLKVVLGQIFHIIYLNNFR